MRTGGFVDHGGARVWLPPGWTAERRWPLILFLHGVGEGGSDGRAPVRVGLGPALVRNPARWPAVAVFPQAPRGQPWREERAAAALAALDRAAAEFSGDPERTTVTGISMGGYGALSLALRHPGRFAGVVAICGGLDLPQAGYRGHYALRSALPGDLVAALRPLAGTPVWIVHGEADRVVPVEESRLAVRALREAGGTVVYTEYAGVGHESWDRAYAEPEVPAWLLGARAPRRVA